MYSDTIILDYIRFSKKFWIMYQKERENISAKHEPSFDTVKCCDDS